MRPMKLLAFVALLAATLFSTAALAQKGTPLQQIDNTGALRCMYVWDLTKPGADKGVTTGCVDTTQHGYIVNGIGASIFGSQTGPTADGSVLTFQNGSKTAYQIYSGVFPGGYYLWGTTRSVLDLESGTTVQHGSAYDAYTYNANAQGSNPNQKNAVGVFVQSVNAATGAASWGFNTACNDSRDNTALHSFASTCNGWEADYFIANAGSIVQGAGFIMSGTAQPAGATGVTVAIGSGSTAKWTAGFVTGDGAVTGGAISIGATATSGSNVASQPEYFNYFNGSGTEIAVSLTAVNGALNFSTTAISDNIGLQPTAGNANIIAGGASSNINIGLFPKGAGIVQANGGFTATGALNGASGGVTGAWSTAALTATGFASFQNNSATIPAAVGAFGVSWNQSAGGAEVDLWNQSTAATPVRSFRFNQVTTGGSAFTTIFEIGSDTGKSSLLNTHLVFGGTAPTMGTCGTSPTIAGHDGAGRITVGTTPGTTCAMTFAQTWTTNAPVCVAQDETTALTARVSTVSTSAVTFTFSGTLTAADKISYSCVGL